MKEHAGTDEIRQPMVHSDDELMRSVRVAPDQVDTPSSVMGTVARVVLWMTDSMYDSGMFLW